jgi:hypothetical protein
MKKLVTILKLVIMISKRPNIQTYTLISVVVSFNNTKNYNENDLAIQPQVLYTVILVYLAVC